MPENLAANVANKLTARSCRPKLMPVVVLIPTGKLEHAALATALERIFSDAAFDTRPRRASGRIHEQRCDEDYSRSATATCR